MMAAAVANHGGHVVDTAGDSLLATFTSAGDAVNCAVDIQREVERRNARVPRDRRLTFRIGIELGDALVEAGAVYGNCVNVAARAQQAASPGGVYVAGAAYDELDGALPLRFDYLGRSSMTNIDTPQRLYRVR
jgi:adenylate cyclase